jgi:6-phosphogluconolactonase
MPEREIRIFPSLEDLSRQAATDFAERARARHALGRSFSAALSGGATPRRLYELLASPPISSRIDWNKAHLFQVDERCVPPDDTQSNFRLIREALLRRVALPAANFHRMAAEQADREGATRAYAAEIARVLKPRADAPPRFDWVLLGMGTDGHTASLFPGSRAVQERTEWVRPNFVEKLGAWRITLTLPVLNAAARVVFLVSGGEKAETLARVLEGPAMPEELPAQAVEPREGTVAWYVDEAAAGVLKNRPRSRA